MRDETICLGIESTAHTFGVSIMSGSGTILSNIRNSYVPAEGRGIHPREAAQHHASVASTTLKRAFVDANVKPKELTCVAIALGPGLGPALRVGATVARALAAFLEVPLIPVHHAVGHIEIGCLVTGAKDPLVLLVTGGHTAILGFGLGRWRVFGETLDITVGNLFDMFARKANLPSPGGPVMEKLSVEAKDLIELPYTVKGNDVSFSGLLTAALNRLQSHQTSLESLCFSIQEVAFSMLTEVTERCLAHTGKKEVLLTGGVAANLFLQEKLRRMVDGHGAQLFVVDKELSGDNGAQIAWTGILAYNAGIRVEIRKSSVRPRWRLDEVPIRWRSDEKIAAETRG